MSSAVLTTTVVAVAVLGSLYQLWLGPLIHTGGVFRKVDTLNNQECRAVSELEGCEGVSRCQSHNNTLAHSTGTLSLRHV